MEAGKLGRLEEPTCMGSDVQDTLITVLSEKALPVPELNMSVNARRGFNVIATANNRDKGVNELSSALKRRFNVVVQPLRADREEEVAIVMTRVAEMGSGLRFPVPRDTAAEVERVVTIFRELRSGQTLDGKTALEVPTGSLSTVEAIAAKLVGLSEAAWLMDGALDAEALAPTLLGAIITDPVQDWLVLEEYLGGVRWSLVFGPWHGMGCRAVGQGPPDGPGA